MFSRNSQPSSSSGARPEDTFLEDVQDLHAENLLSAQRASKLLRKACKAGINVPKNAIGGTAKNMSRAHRRRALRRTKWPRYYWFNCRVLDRKTREERTVKLCMLLPQEVIHTIWKLGSSEALLDTDNLDTESLAHLQWIKDQLGVEEALAFGIHGDGIPCNYDRTESVVMISLNLPGLSGRNGRLRIPLVALPDWAASSNTYDDIMAVIAWSMRNMLTRSKPCCRHDGTEWWDSDKSRKEPNYDPTIPVPCTMVQARGDWDWMGKCFHLPFHNVKTGCCWLCRVQRHEVIIRIYIYIYIYECACKHMRIQLLEFR